MLNPSTNSLLKFKSALSMVRPSRIIPVVALMASLFLPTDGSDNRRREEQKRQEMLAKAHQELGMLQKRLEEVKVGRWQDKRNTVAAQEAFQKMWDDLKRELDQMNQVKTRKDEMLLRLRGQSAEREQVIASQEDRYRQFRYTLLEKVDETYEKSTGAFPHELPERQAAWAGMQKKVADEKALLHEPITEVFRLQAEQFRLEESSGIARESLPIKGEVVFEEQNPGVRLPESIQGRIAAGITIRLGTFYKAFVSTEGEDAAILVKTGQLGPNAWQWMENIPTAIRNQLHAVAEKLVAEEGAAGESLVVLLPVDVQLRNASGDGFRASSQMGIIAYMADEFSKGGFAVYLIVGSLILGLLIALEKMVMLAYHSISRKKMDKVMAHLEAGEHRNAQEAARELRGAAGDLLKTVTDMTHISREDTESRAHASLLRNAPRMDRNLSTLNVLAAAAPLLGLLGTVSGMINLFTAITVHGTEDPRFMADGIAEALITTKWGLLVAVPLLLIYSLLSDWANRIVADMERYGTEGLNLIHGQRDGMPVVNPTPMHSEAVTVATSET